MTELHNDSRKISTDTEEGKKAVADLKEGLKTRRWVHPSRPAS
ncbi:MULTISPECIES: hypothetical protein [Mesorhizobium]|nr:MULTISPECIES: hypothetical protein [Mesorhizobium]